VLLKAGVAISMDGKGAWRDNVFVERLWRSVKYEEIYLRAYDKVRDVASKPLDFGRIGSIAVLVLTRRRRREPPPQTARTAWPTPGSARCWRPIPGRLVHRTRPMTTARAKAAFRGETASLGETTARAETAAPKSPTLKTQAPTTSVPVTSVLATPVPAAPGAPPRLSDAALLLLGQAAAREDRLLLPPPAAMRARGSALQKVLQALLKAGLVTEVSVATEAQSWRSGADGARIGLVIAVEGFRAIGLAVPAPAPAAPAPVALVSAAITAGQGGSPAAEPAGRITKQATLIAMLSDDAGASVPTLSETLKWQIHTVRAALTGLRQKGHELARTKDAAGTTIYRITGRASAEAAGATGATGGAAVMGA